MLSTAQGGYRNRMDRPASQEAAHELAELIDDIPIGMLTTMGHDGNLRSRPLARQSAPINGDLWFFVDLTSDWVAELELEELVNVSFAKPEEERWVSVAGTAELVHDVELAEQLWSTVAATWFPDGPRSDNLAVLQVTVHEAEHWDGPAGRLTRIADFVGALANGN
jgi:general stress protein 26